MPPLEQTAIALQAGATMVQYRNKAFRLESYFEAAAIRDLCRRNAVPFLVNDNTLLAKALGADGVHLGQEDDPPQTARRILGPTAIIGLSVSNLGELEASDLAGCDYIGSGPVFATATKADAGAVLGPKGLFQIVAAAPLPVVAIGGIDRHTAGSCFEQGAAGVAVISCITRSRNPRESALAFGAACGCRPRNVLT